MKRALILFSLLIAGVVLGDPATTKIIDFSGATAPGLQVYQANQKTFQWTMKNNNATLDCTGQIPFMWIAASNKAAGVVTSACSWVTQTAGVFNASFSPSMLNTNGSWIYGVGMTSNQATEARCGVFTIIADPYATGAGSMVLVTNLNWSLYTFLNVADGPLLEGSNVVFGAYGARGQYKINVVLTGVVDWAQHVVLSQRVDVVSNKLEDTSNTLVDVSTKLDTTSNTVVNISDKLNVISNRVVDAEAGIVSNVSAVANVSNQSFTTLPAWIANVSGETYNVLSPKLDATSNDVVSARLVADAGSNLAYTVWGWGNHALVGYLTAGSNVSSLINDAGYLANNISFTGATIWATSVYATNFYGNGTYLTNIPSSAITGGTTIVNDGTNGYFLRANSATELQWVNGVATSGAPVSMLANDALYITDAAITGMSGTQALHSSQIGSNQLAITGLANTNESHQSWIDVINANIVIVSNAVVQTNVLFKETGVDVGTYMFSSTVLYTNTDTTYLTWSNSQWWLKVAWEMSGSITLENPTDGQYSGGGHTYDASWLNYTSYYTTVSVTNSGSSTSTIQNLYVTNIYGNVIIIKGTNLGATASIVSNLAFNILSPKVDAGSNFVAQFVITNNVPALTNGTQYTTNLNYNTATGQTNIVQKILINTNNAGLGSLTIGDGTTTNTGLRINDAYLYRSAANTLAASALQCDFQLLSVAFRPATATGDILMKHRSAAAGSAKFVIQNAYGDALFSVTNNSGTIIVGTGNSAATSTNALELSSGTNLTTIGENNGLLTLNNINSAIFTNLPTSPAGLPVGALWASGSNLILNLVPP